jgi:hypothetical protein
VHVSLALPVPSSVHVSRSPLRVLYHTAQSSPCLCPTPHSPPHASVPHCTVLPMPLSHTAQSSPCLCPTPHSPPHASVPHRTGYPRALGRIQEDSPHHCQVCDLRFSAFQPCIVTSYVPCPSTCSYIHTALHTSGATARSSSLSSSHSGASRSISRPSRPSLRM